MADSITKSILSVYATVESNLANLAVKDGQLIFVQDKHKIALDFGSKRTIYHQIQELATEGARTSLLAPVSGSYYFVLETAILWKYQGGWIQITTPPSEVIGSSEVEEMVNSIIQEKIDNGIIVETDPTVPDWAKASTKPTYTASEVGADASGVAANLLSAHNSASNSHSDIRSDIDTLFSEKVGKAGLSLGIHTDGLVYIFVDGNPVGTGIELSNGGISGYVDSENNIIITGLPDGTYTVKYEMEDGSVIDIGNLELVGDGILSSRLPAEYQEVEWVQINDVGTTHAGIKTDLLWSRVNKIVTKIQNVEITNTTDMFFSTWGTETTKAAPFIATSGSNMCGNGSGLANYAVSPNDIAASNTDVNTFTMTWDSASPDGTIFFGSWQDDAYSNPHKWCVVEFYSDDALVGEFIPCYRISDSVIGFYDTASDKFYGNASSSGTFFKGPDTVNGGTTDPDTPDEPDTPDVPDIPTETNYFDASAALLNHRLGSSGSPSAYDGMVTTDFIQVDALADDAILVVSGVTLVNNTAYGYAKRTVWYDANKTMLSADNAPAGQFCENIAAQPPTGNASYVRVAMVLKDAAAITAADIAGLKITLM